MPRWMAVGRPQLSGSSRIGCVAPQAVRLAWWLCDSFVDAWRTAAERFEGARQRLVRTDDDGTTAPKPRDELRGDGLLRELVEVREGGVTAQNDVERTVGHHDAHVLAPKRDASRELFADAKGAVANECDIAELERQ